MRNEICLKCLCFSCEYLMKDGSCAVDKHTPCNETCYSKIGFSPVADTACYDFKEIIPEWRIKVN